METLSKKCILETIEASEEYTALLDSLLDKAEVAENQVVKSAQCASLDIEQMFNEITTSVMSTLNARKNALLESINKFKTESLVPLRLCKKEILSKKELSDGLRNDAKNVLSIGGFKSEEMYNNFMNKSSAIGALPALPELELVPFITAQGSPNEIISDFKSSISLFGNVCKIGPVQIAGIEPKPGSLLVRWEEIDSDSSVDIQSYKLQMTTNDLWSKNKETVFGDVYEGSEVCHLVKDIRPKELYCFRVCCRINAESGWSAWSQVKVSSTDIPPFTWDTTNSHYLVSNDDKLVRMITPGFILFSSSNHISHSHSVQFTIINSGDFNEEEGVALCASNQQPTGSLIRNGTLFVSFRGFVFIDGKKKMINLPVVENNGVIVLSCEIVKHKWRVTIESGTKAVTYDWDTGTERLFFATVLCQSKTQVLVE